jgi:cell wall-associated NlpC family hydrolase
MQVFDSSQIKDLIGKPFEDGGRGPEVFDCWGLVMEVYRRHGLELPDYKIGAHDVEEIDGEIQDNRPAWDEHISGEIPVPSVVVIRLPGSSFCNHCGVFIGAGRFIHAREKTGVCIDRTTSPAWCRRIDGFYTPPDEVQS